MIQIIGKFLKVFLFGITPLFLVSGSSKIDTVNLECGTYEFIVSGKYNKRIVGIATFSNTLEEDTFGNKINQLELKFEPKDNCEIKSIEFVIANGVDNIDSATIGHFRIKHLDRLLNKFNGVYGFVDIGGLEESPFFTEEGSIVIVESFNHSVLGRVEVQLKSASDESLRIKGFFNAN